MLLGRSRVDLERSGRPAVNSVELLLLLLLGTAGAMENIAALKVATLMGFSGFG